MPLTGWAPAKNQSPSLPPYSLFSVSHTWWSESPGAHCVSSSSATNVIGVAINSVAAPKPKALRPSVEAALQQSWSPGLQSEMAQVTTTPQPTSGPPEPSRLRLIESWIGTLWYSWMQIHNVHCIYIYTCIRSQVIPSQVKIKSRAENRATSKEQDPFLKCFCSASDFDK